MSSRWLNFKEQAPSLAGAGVEVHNTGDVTDRAAIILVPETVAYTTMSSANSALKTKRSMKRGQPWATGLGFYFPFLFSITRLKRSSPLLLSVAMSGSLTKALWMRRR